MKPITYISNKNRNNLVLLRDRLARVMEPEERNEIQTEITEIEESRKPLSECTVEECEEMKEFVFSKFNALVGIGKNSSAMQFRTMLIQIDSRIQTVHLEQSKKEAEMARQSKEARANGMNKKKVAVANPEKNKSKWSIDLSGVK